MSLFGDESQDRLSGSTARVKSSLFDDEAPTKSAAGGGLFADTTADEGDSPWDFTSSRKQHARESLVKTLLSPEEVPESYIDAWDALLASDLSSGLSSIAIDGVQKLLSGSSVSKNQQDLILRIIAPSGSTSFGRGEFCVLLALIGLAQEGEEPSLDGVDDRRKRLPEPRLPAIRRAQPPAPAVTQHQPPAYDSPSFDTPRRPDTQNSFGYPDSDPWGSPANTRSNMTQQKQTGSNSGMKFAEQSTHERTTSTFSSSGAGTGDNVPSVGSTASGAGETWGGYNSTTGTDFGSGSLGGSGGFGDAPGDGGNGQPPPAPIRTPRPTRQVSLGAQEVLTVTALPDKEGMFLFQHRNYEISSTRKNTKVVRRFSDFAWLLECLHKKYPFRQLPLLPPKRVAINGNHIAADNSFIEKRRKGLSRFVNALIRHPVLKEEQLVTMFLTVPTELAAWRKQASISVLEEFTNRPLPAGLEDTLPDTLEELFTNVRSGVRRSSEHYINLCNLVERLIKRRDGLALEYSRMAASLASLTEASGDTYSFDNNDVPMLNEGLNATAKHASAHQALLESENKSWDANALEDLKTHRDALVAMRDLFDRKDRLSKDTIPTLEKRIATNENKLSAVRSKPESQRKPNDAEKLEEAIVKDKQSIVDQHNRSVFIRECVRDEISNFQANLLHVGRSMQNWAAERAEFGESFVVNWRSWEGEVEGMPVDGA